MRDKKSRKAFKNTSGETIPAWAFVRINDTADANKQPIIQGTKPDGGASSAYLTNDAHSIADTKIGHGHWTDEICIVAYDPAGEVPVVGDTWGPVNGSWYLDVLGDGFLVVAVDAANGIARVVRTKSSSSGVVSCECGSRTNVAVPVVDCTVAGSAAKGYATHVTIYGVSQSFPLQISGTPCEWTNPAPITVGTCDDGYGGTVYHTVNATLTVSTWNGPCGTTLLCGKIHIVTDVNNCSATQNDLDVTYISWNFHPRRTSRFDLVDPTTPGNFSGECIICTDPYFYF